MRKEWMNPEIAELSVKGTEKVEPIIVSTFQWIHFMDGVVLAV